MADTYTSSLRIVQETIGGNENSWGTLNNSALAMLDEAIAGQVSVSVTAGDVTLTTANNATDQSRPALLILTGTPGVTRNVTMPDVKKLTWVYNNCSDGSSVTVKSGVGTNVSVPAGGKQLLYSDGATNVVGLSPVYIEWATFTPVLQFGGATTGITYMLQQGRYRRIGNKIEFEIFINLSSKGSASGNATMTGLPVVSAAVVSRHLLTGFYYLITHNTAGGYYSPFVSVAGTTATIDLQEAGSGVVPAAITDTDFVNTSRVQINGSYEV
jgi:hypothetical protein